MACHYEEEVYEKEGKIDKCGCPECPYKNLIECYEGKNKSAKVGLIHQDAFYRGVDEERERHQK